MNQIIGEVDADFMNQAVLQNLLILAEDQVPNIRFNVSKCI